MKRIVPFLTVAAVALALAGCKSSKAEIKPKEYTSVPLYMAGQEIPGDAQEKYLYNASVKMYSVGRLVDSGSGTMREGGTIYRVERAPQWNLVPQYDANPESFARRKLQEQYAESMTGQIHRNLSETQAVKTELHGTKAELLQLEAACRELQRTNANLLAEIRKGAEDNKTAVQNMRLMQKYIQKLENKLEDLKIQNFGGRK